MTQRGEEKHRRAGGRATTPASCQAPWCLSIFHVALSFLPGSEQQPSSGWDESANQSH